jgi:flagellar hook assembly protein FlgD
VEVSIYNILGQKVRILEEGTRDAGIHNLTWDGRNAYQQLSASGLYFYRITVEGARMKEIKLTGFNRTEVVVDSIIFPARIWNTTIINTKAKPLGSKVRRGYRSV